MKRRRAVRYVLIVAVIAGIAVLIVVRALPGTQRLSDAQVVFCLSSGERVQLAGAAVSLGLAKTATPEGVLVGKGRDLTVEEWRQTFPSAFGRACLALTDSARIPAGGSADPGVIVSLLINLAGVLAGGLIGWMSSEFRAAAERNRAQAEALATARANLTARFLTTFRPGRIARELSLQRSRSEQGERSWWRSSGSCSRFIRAGQGSPHSGRGCCAGIWAKGSLRLCSTSSRMSPTEAPLAAGQKRSLRSGNLCTTSALRSPWSPERCCAHRHGDARTPLVRCSSRAPHGLTWQVCLDRPQVRPKPAYVRDLIGPGQITPR